MPLTVNSPFSSYHVSRMDNMFGHLWKLIGNTPMLDIHYEYRGRPGNIYVKCEHDNLTGSIKDRVALHALYQACKNDSIKPGNILIEASNSKTAIAFAAIGTALGYEMTIVMPGDVSNEQIALIEGTGARVYLGDSNKSSFTKGICVSQQAKKLQCGFYIPFQLEDEYEADAHELTTAPEIWQQLQSINLTPDAFIAADDANGIVKGIGRYFMGINPGINLHPLTFTEAFTPQQPFIGLNSTVQVQYADVALMVQKLSRDLWLEAGVVSAANIMGAIKLREQMGNDATVVTLLSDKRQRRMLTAGKSRNGISYMHDDITFIGYNTISCSPETLI